MSLIVRGLRKADIIRHMRITFRYQIDYATVLEEDPVLSVAGATWFVAILREIPRLEVQPEVIQEDWGVFIKVHRDRAKFWIGLSEWNEHGMWIAHVHRDDWFWLRLLLRHRSFLGWTPSWSKVVHRSTDRCFWGTNWSETHFHRAMGLTLKSSNDAALLSAGCPDLYSSRGIPRGS
jgi:hypothetical protein